MIDIKNVEISLCKQELEYLLHALNYYSMDDVDFLFDLESSDAWWTILDDDNKELMKGAVTGFRCYTEKK